MPVTLTEEDRQQAHKEALDNRPPECRCAVEIYIVHNGTDWAHIEIQYDEQGCPVHS